MMPLATIRPPGPVAGKVASAPVSRPLVIAVINNMPDAALRTAERQICKVLAAASDGMLVDVRFYSLATIPRSEQARAHIASCYDDIAGLESDRPDGLIVTGTEPLTSRLSDEAFWRPLCNLIEWSDQEGIPAIWSCLAAHAALLRLDGIERQHLGRKLSGLFTCSAQVSQHQIMHRMPRKWAVPHSRWNGLDRNALHAQGYTILSTAGSAGVDMFMKQAPVLQLFMQGHLEYEPATLLAEYRRDVMRAAATERPVMPDLPVGLADKGMAEQIQREAKAIVYEHRHDVIPRLDLLLRAAKPAASWEPVAQTLFRNWLSYLDVCGTRATPAIAPFEAAFQDRSRSCSPRQLCDTLPA